ncbi:MAG TPA: DUF4175 family protein [Dokdonella sp.]|uniref:DUF4175 family protein n=1 Tax=Dokdonella sp. TaxID=2291710 RepID=UPI002D8097CB|nr:DUF4175 family protein [Dokdonella sp.]HET9033826.1 DUF4175 family protein [Dokdonella sp.]
MSHAVIGTLRKRMIRRHVANVLIWVLPLIAAVALLTRLASFDVVLAATFLALVVLVYRLIRAVRCVDDARVVRRLDASSPVFEDSADLLLGSAAKRTALEDLQRQRLLANIRSTALPDLRPAWSWRVPLLLAGIMLVLIPLAGLLPGPALIPLPQSNGSAQPETRVLNTTIRSSLLDIEAPAYTGLAARSEPVLEAKVAAGSQLRWRLEFDPQPVSAKLQFHDGSEIPLQQEQSVWVGEKVLNDSALYRIAIDSSSPLLEDRLYRLDAIVDQPPEIHVLLPDKTLSLVDAGQRTWSLEFEVTDDYGIGDARLAMTLAQGSGEQVTVSERSERLRAEASADPRRQRFRRQLDPASLGFAAGDDLIVRLIVSDQRTPSANTSRSASYILRWPPERASDGEGVEGIVQKVLPAYFRSQRQIIIDSEALIEEHSRLDDDRFLARSDKIGVDQKILRLRYGQFLGEEFESGAAERHEPGEHDDDKATQQDALTEDHGHEPEGSSASTFGEVSNILAEYGHTHDHAGAATLLDPQTKKILKSALAEMWQAELHLRQGHPGKALPYENRALAYIKQVQQSTRIYLSRVGLELPPVDTSRRLTGERKGLRDPRGVLVDSDRDDQKISHIYQSLSSDSSVDLEAFDGWLRGEGAKRADALNLIAAVDALRRQPQCSECRERLLNLLWQALPPSPVVTRLRDTPDAAGRDYLDRINDGTLP